MFNSLKIAKKINTSDSKINKSTTKISNELVEALFKKNNLHSLKLLMYISSKNLILEPNEIYTFRLQVKPCIKALNCNSEVLRTNLKQMVETAISIKNGNSLEYISIIPYINFINSDVIEIKIFHKVYTLISNLKNQFTIIDVNEFNKLKSKNTARLLLLLERINSYSDNIAKKQTFDLEDLNLLFGTKYKSYYSFIDKVLEPSKLELEKNSNKSFFYDVRLDYESKQKGRPKIKHLDIYLTKPKEIII